jgi:hypothetical protein
MKIYNTRTWLNPKTSDHTGSIVCFSGNVLYDQKNIDRKYIEIADCHCKVKIHKGMGDRDVDFINKISKLRDEIDNFIVFLKENIADE